MAARSSLFPPELSPFALGHPSHLKRLPDSINGVALLKLAAPMTGGVTHSPVSGEGARFARLLNLGNALAYGGEMGMPEWVMLDCGLLPTSFMGLCRRGKTLGSQRRIELNARLARLEREMSPERARAEQLVGVPSGPIQDDEWVPVAEFCALPTLTPGEVMGYSLYSLERGLGVRAKALGLYLHAALGAQSQLGVAQYSNLAAIKSHLSFGPLALVDPLTPLHTRAGETFIYRLTIPPRATLLEMMAGKRAHSRRDAQASQGELFERQERAHWVRSDELEAWAELRSLSLADATCIELIDARLKEGRPSLRVRLTARDAEGTRA